MYRVVQKFIHENEIDFAFRGWLKDAVYASSMSEGQCVSVCMSVCIVRVLYIVYIYT